MPAIDRVVCRTSRRDQFSRRRPQSLAPTFEESQPLTTFVDDPATSKNTTSKPRANRASAAKNSEPPKPIAKTSSPKPAPTVIADPSAKTERKSLVADEFGRTVVARVLDGPEGRPLALLPDGRLGVLERIVDTDEPFQPATADEVERRLLDGPCKGFEVVRSEHYLVFYNGTKEFAKASDRLLESLHQGLIRSFKKNGLDVHKAEFPLVAIIYRDEGEFRRRREIAPEIQAYYEILTNRIYFFEKSERDRESPEVAALRKPQTVAHEGVHQVLQNIGVQPRLAPWPIWLVEGLAEDCATTSPSRRSWERMGVVNPFHMATIHDIQDPAPQVGGNQRRGGRPARRSIVEDLIAKTELTPTDYALSWALTHYLALRRGEDFAAYLRTLGKLSPGDVRTPQDHLDAFRLAFKTEPAKLDKKVGAHLTSLKYDKIPYYAVTFERVVPNGLITRTGLVSQSPSVIREWLDETAKRIPGIPSWHIFTFPDREDAVLVLREWMNGQ